MLAWMDLEMTGLDPARHVIVEVATLLTDDELNPIAEGPDIVVQARAHELAQMDDLVRNMHTRSGLLELDTALRADRCRGRPPDARVPQGTHSHGAHRPALRQLDRD